MQDIKPVLFSTLLCACTLLSIFAGGAAQADDSLQDPEAAVNAFFGALSIAAQEGKTPQAQVTDDFTVFEVGQVFDRDSFYELIKSAGGAFKTMEWVLSDFTVTTSEKLAHVSYRNDGQFLDAAGNTMVSYWLESALLISGEDGWKIKFLQSDLVTRERHLADGSVVIMYPNVTD